MATGTIKFSNNFEWLNLFEQDLYCFDHISAKSLYTTEEERKSAAKIWAACFRQAREFLFAAQQITLATKPLQLAYAFNSYIKGAAHLTSGEKELIGNFGKHGFKIEEGDIKDNFIDSKIVIKGNGVTRAIEKMLKLNPFPTDRPISIGELLSMIPNVARYYHHLYEKAPRVFEASMSSTSGTMAYHVRIKNGISPEDLAKEYDALDKLKLIFEYSDRWFIIQNTLGFKEKVPESIREQITTGDYCILPITVNDKPYWCPPLYTCYLLILTYSMMARYGADKWDDFINPRKSKSYTIIELSTEYALNIFLESIAYLLTGPNNRYYNSQIPNEFTRLLIQNKRLIAEIVKSSRLHGFG